MDNLLIEIAHQATDKSSMLIRPDQAAVFLQICQPKSFQGALIGDTVFNYIDDKDFWRNLYTVLKEKATVSVTKVNS